MVYRSRLKPNTDSIHLNPGHTRDTLVVGKITFEWVCAVLDASELERRMSSALDVLGKELSGLRTGRASVNLVEPIRVDAYGQMVPMNQVGTISTPEARMVTIQVWDKGLVKAVEKAIANANLGLNPAVDGQLVRIPLPPLTEERRQELVKVAAQYAESARVSVRNVRRDGMETLKSLEKSKEISEDDHHRQNQDIQKMTDQWIKKVDDLLASKQKDIMAV